MFRPRRLSLFLAVLLLSGCAAGATPDVKDGSNRPVPALHSSVDGYPDATLRLIGGSGRTVTIAAKVANTTARRRHGLMEVPALPDGVGMLFVFPADHSGGFWMKDTLIPLDIAFVARDGAVNEILRMEPCISTSCPLYDRGIPYRYALEVRAGWFEQVGVDADWRLELPASLPPPS